MDGVIIGDFDGGRKTKDLGWGVVNTFLGSEFYFSSLITALIFMQSGVRELSTIQKGRESDFLSFITIANPIQ